MRTTLTGNAVKESQSLSQPVNDEHKNSDVIDGMDNLSNPSLTVISNDLKNATSQKYALSNLHLETMALETFRIDF